MKAIIFFLKFGFKVTPTCAFTVFKRIVIRRSIGCGSANLIFVNNEISYSVLKVIYVF